LQNPTFTYTTFGNYNVDLTIGYQGHTCNGTTSQSITVLMPAPIITITPDNALIIAGDTIQLTASGATSYEWTPAEGLNNTSIADPLAFPGVTTTYQVVSTDANTCVGMAEVVITVEIREELAIVAPKMFSPNGDTYSDFWVIEGIRTFPECKLTVFARNGKIILETLDYQDDWKGFDDDGNEMPEGAYYYTITCPDGLSASGSVSIIR
jgi:gliding motility-associated-like protein